MPIMDYVKLDSFVFVFNLSVFNDLVCVPRLYCGEYIWSRNGNQYRAIETVQKLRIAINSKS